MNKKIDFRKPSAILEVIILIAGMFAFVYFVGEEFGVVSAVTISCGVRCGSDKDHQCTNSEQGCRQLDIGAGPGVVNGKCTLEIDRHDGDCCCIPKPSSSSTTTPSCIEGAIGQACSCYDTSGASYSSTYKCTGGQWICDCSKGTSKGGGQGDTTNQQDNSPKTEQGGSIWGNIGSAIGFVIVNAGIAVGLYYTTNALGNWMKSWAGNALGSLVADYLSLGISIGYGAGALAYMLGAQSEILFQTTFMGVTIAIPTLALTGAIIGAVIAVIIWFGTYTDKKLLAVIYTCSAWQPESGGANCQKCNKGEFPCTKYQCESLGLGCELLNPGTDDEVCEWVNRNDISPPTIETWSAPLKENYVYTPDSAILPPDRGVKINYEGLDSEDGCAPAFAKITYGIGLDKPGRCRYDFVRTDKFEDMKFQLSNGYYKYNHTLLSLHAGVQESLQEGIEFPNGGDFEVYVRCESRNGYSNQGTFVFKYCVQKEPDTAPPTIVITEPVNGMPIQYEQTSKNATIYTDKPADCKWSHNSESFDSMTGTMDCADSITDINANLLYKCTTNITGLKDETTNNIYILCKSYPGSEEGDRYTMPSPYLYKLIGTRPLVMDWIKPESDSTIRDSTQSVKVTLEAHTSAGYKEGEALCFSKDISLGEGRSYVLFESDALDANYQHSQDLWLLEGNYKYSIRCCDAGGNCKVDETEFSVETDTDAPLVIRTYNEEKKLKVTTNEKAECVYDITSCSYNFDEGSKMLTTNNINHFADWNTDNNYYIKCKDEFGNQPNPDECTIIVRPFVEYK